MTPTRSFLIPFGQTQDHSIDYLLGMMRDARITTLQRIHNITTEELHWQYAEGWNSVSALLSHFHALSHAFRISFLENRALTPEEEKAYFPGLQMGKFLPQLITHQPVEHYIEILADSEAQILAQIKQLSPEDFHKKRSGYHPENGCNLAWVLYHLAEDEINHRGQITLIRKLYRHAHTT